jgi:hypothetical protein
MAYGFGPFSSQTKDETELWSTSRGFGSLWATCFGKKEMKHFVGSYAFKRGAIWPSLTPFEKDTYDSRCNLCVAANACDGNDEPGWGN